MSYKKGTTAGLILGAMMLWGGFFAFFIILYVLS
jgi:hypothetical protein